MPLSKGVLAWGLLPRLMMYGCQLMCPVWFMANSLPSNVSSGSRIQAPDHGL